MKHHSKKIFLILLSFLFTQLQAQDKPNVVMIVLDDLNDYIGVMGGHPQTKTPNIDKLAGEGVLFQNAHSNCPVCMPSRASFMTGVLPTSTGMWDFNNWLKNETLKHTKTLPEYARDNGYRTFQTGKVLHNPRKGAWDEMGVFSDYGPLAYNGKKTVQHPSNPEAMGVLGALDATFVPLSDVPNVPATNNAPGYKGWYNAKWSNMSPFKYNSPSDRDKLTDEKSADWFADKIAQLEEEEGDKPFLIGVGFIRPHTPLVVPQKYYDMFPVDSMQHPVYLRNDRADCKAVTLGKDKSRGETAFEGLKSGYGSPDLAIKKYIQAYLASVAFADAQVGKVLDALNKSKFKDNTIVILFSDHGYNMGEKDYLFKYCHWEETTRVPLIIRHPDYKKNAGKTVDHPVSLVDVFPTIADFCGMKGETKTNSKGADVDGHSLKAFVEKPSTEKWDGPDVALTVTSSWTSKKPSKQNLSVRSKDFRYILYGNGGEELYNHKKDPYEWNNLAEMKKYAKIKAELKQKMFAQIK